MQVLSLGSASLNDNELYHAGLLQEGRVDASGESTMINPYRRNRNVYTCVNQVIIGGSVFAIVSSTILSILLENIIFENTLEIQAKMQSALNNKVLGFIMNVIANTVHPMIVVGILVAIFAFSRKKFEILNFLLYFAIVSYLCSIAKTLFASPRPYWVGKNIYQWEWICYQEYGNPSGHSLLGPLFYEFMLQVYVLRRIDMEKKLSRRLAKFSYVLLIISIIFCRLYLGMHSINQVTYGLILGCSLIALYRFYFEVQIKRVLLFLLRSNINKAQRPLACSYIILAFFSTLTLPCLIYIIQQNSGYSDSSSVQAWKLQIEEKCDLESVDPLKAFFSRCFIDCSGICICFALLLGFLYSNRPEFLIGRYIAHSNLFVRSLVIGGSSLLSILAFIIIPTEQVGMKFALQSMGIFTSGLCLISLAPFILFDSKMVLPLHKHLHEELIEELNDNSNMYYNNYMTSPNQLYQQSRSNQMNTTNHTANFSSEVLNDTRSSNISLQQVIPISMPPSSSNNNQQV